MRIFDENEIEFIDNSNRLSAEDKNTLMGFLGFLEDNIKDTDKLKSITGEELAHVIEIAKISPNVQLKIWRILPDEVVNDERNWNIFESVLENKFGEYINGVDKKGLVKFINDNRIPSGLSDQNGNMVWNPSMLDQIQSPVFEEPAVTNAFTFEQVLEIVLTIEREQKLRYIVDSPKSEAILKRIGSDTQNWRDQLQYLMNLTNEERSSFLLNFGTDGSELIQKELKRREKLFEAMERGYFEQEDEQIQDEFEEDYEDYELDCDIYPENLLSAIFGISKDEAKELMKKYGKDINKLSIETEEDKKTYIKLQTIKYLTEPKEFEDYDDMIEYYSDFYYNNRETLLKISKEISPFYKVDLERDFLDLYARQYDRKLGAQATRIEDTVYEGKNIPTYKAIGDFTILARGEQNVSSENERNFWDRNQVYVKGQCQVTISQDYIRTSKANENNTCFIGTTTCKDGELRMASTTNIQSKDSNLDLSVIGISSDYGNGIEIRIPQEQINNSRGINNETVISKNKFQFILYIQDTNDVDIENDPNFKTAQFAASKTGGIILIIPREECAQREEAKIQELKEKLLGTKERKPGETDEELIRNLVVKFNNNREGILTSKGLKGKYFTEDEHIQLIETINTRLTQLKSTNLNAYEQLIQSVSQIYKEEINKYYAYSYDRQDGIGELDFEATREHVKPYEDFLIEQEKGIINLSENEKNNIYSMIKNISETSYYDMNEAHALSHIQKVIMFSGILAKNENLSHEETQQLLIAAAFHDSGRNGAEGEFDNHAEASAINIKEYFESNPNNPFHITDENIAKIQAIIEYHEHRDKEKGRVDDNELKRLCKKYEVDFDEFNSIKKMSALLKDADALDRARFGKRSENRASLDYSRLRSETAKTISMIRFSEECNDIFKEKENIPEGVAEEIFDSELDRFNPQKTEREKFIEGIRVEKERGKDTPGVQRTLKISDHEKIKPEER